MLNCRIGWRVAELDRLEQAPADLSLCLEPLPGSRINLAEPSGSLGGLVLPGNVAMNRDGAVFLLDRDQALLKRFDPCLCRFEVVPCLGGEGSEPRQLKSARGIGIACGNLFVCDAENHRVQVFSLNGFVLRALWQVPDLAGLTNPWKPYAIVFDRRFRAYVSDTNNGCIHVFSPNGFWLRSIEGLGAVTHLAIDPEERLYVTAGGASEILIIDLSGRALASVSRRDQIADRFKELPFTVDAAGRLLLGGLCTAAGVKPHAELGLFDLSGDPIDDEPDQENLEYPKRGTYLSRALDSRIAQCQWHRIELWTDLPGGTRIRVFTYSAESDRPIDLISSLDDDAWDTQQTLHSGIGPSWDCLVRSKPGRYLWLKLALEGNGEATPRVASVRLEYPRISLARYLPAVLRADPMAGELTDRLLSLFDRTLRQVEWQIDHQARLFDPLATPSGGGASDPRDFLTWLGSWLGIVLERHWPEAMRRRLLAQAGRLLPWRGTVYGLYRQLLLYLGFDIRLCPETEPECMHGCHQVTRGWRPPSLILEHYKLRRWLFLGHGRLSENARLWGRRIVNRSQLDENAQLDSTQLTSAQDPWRDPFHHYAHHFSVFIPGCFKRSPMARKGLERLLRAERPAHTEHQIVYVEPRFRIGVQSMIGFDAAIGKYPEGFALDHTTNLGRATLLASGRLGGPSMKVDARSRVGLTTKLD
jgi:phage tail-like protein